jgi:hypothetical protein
VLFDIVNDALGLKALRTSTRCCERRAHRQSRPVVSR